MTQDDEEQECPCEYPHYHDYSLEDTFEKCTCEPDCYHIAVAAPAGGGE